MKAVNKALLLLVSLLLHLLIIGSLFFFFLPFAKWYFNKVPLLGVDFYNTVTHVSYLKRYFQLPTTGFLDIWFTGFPLYQDPILLHFYAILPLTLYFSIIDAVKYYTLGSTFLFCVFSYFLFFRLNRNHLISGALSLLTLYSVGFFGSLTWGGSIPYYTTQMFLPLVILILVVYLQTYERRWFALAALFAGWSFLGHPSLAGTFIIPASILILLLGQYKNKVTILGRIFRTLFFLFLAVIVGYPVTSKFITFAFTLLSLFGDLGKKASSFVMSPAGSTNASNNINLVAQYYEKLGWSWISDTHVGIFIILGLFSVIAIVVFLFRKDKNNVVEIVPFLIFAIYAVIQVLVNAYGVFFLNQGWYRQFWQFAFIFSSLASIIIGNTLRVFFSKRTLNLIIHCILGIVIFGLAVVLYQSTSRDIISRIESSSSPSSAYPEALSIYLKDKEKTVLISKLLPSWLKGTDKQYRLYESDAQVNVWWSSAYDIPLVKGYVDPPVGTHMMGNLFLLDQAIGGEGLVKNFKYDEVTAKNMALFYIDWYGINTFEGGHVSISPNPFLSSYLADDPKIVEKKEEVETKGVIRLHETKSGKPEIYWDVAQYLVYSKFKDEITSPILSATNAPSILFFTDSQGFEYFTRMLSAYNYNSKYIIPIKIEESIDKYTLDDLKQFPAIILYNYRYRQKNKAFKLLKSYAEQGGKIFIDTGSNSPEGESKNLNDFFPFQSTKRKILGNQWSWEKGVNPIIDNVNIELFGPPEYEDSGWKFSVPEQDLSSADVILKNHNEPMLATWQIGKGYVLWSGMNLPFHYVRNNIQEEGKIFINFLKQIMELKEYPLLSSKVEFLYPGHVKITPPDSAKGILYKHELWQNWIAKSNLGNLPIYSAGPTYNGFIYIPLKSSNNSQIEIFYKGKIQYWLNIGLSFSVSIILLLDFISSGLITGMILPKIKKKFSSSFSKWWEKDDEN